MIVYFSQTAVKQIEKLDNSVKIKLKKWQIEIEALQDPRSKGKALFGSLKGLWRYRVEDYRIICDIQDNNLKILVLKIGHRSSVYA